MKDYNKAKPVRRPYDKRPYFSREIASLSHQDSRPINSNRFFLAVTAIIQRGCGLVECGGDGWGACVNCSNTDDLWAKNFFLNSPNVSR